MQLMRQVNHQDGDDDDDDDDDDGDDDGDDDDNVYVHCTTEHLQTASKRCCHRNFWSGQQRHFFSLICFFFLFDLLDFTGWPADTFQHYFLNYFVFTFWQATTSLTFHNLVDTPSS